MTIALLTDFGQGSIFVGQMKAIIAGIVPHFPLIDLAHDIAPGEPEAIVGEGAFLLERSLAYLPAPCIVCAVVDPGVGTERRVLLVESGKLTLVGPDNGLLAPAIDRDPHAVVTAVQETRWFLPERSRTFHGRDVFAPLAAHLARGLRVAGLGPRLAPGDVVRLAAPPAAPGATSGQVRSVDRFGNLITDVAPRRGLASVAGVRLGGGEPIAATAETFGRAEPGAPFVTVGGLGTLEVCLRGQSAAAALGLGRGAAVEVRYRDA